MILFKISTGNCNILSGFWTIVISVIFSCCTSNILIEIYLSFFFFADRQEKNFQKISPTQFEISTWENHGTPGNHDKLCTSAHIMIETCPWSLCSCVCTWYLYCYIFHVYQLGYKPLHASLSVLCFTPLPSQRLHVQMP